MAFDFEALVRAAVEAKEASEQAALDKLTDGVFAAAVSVQGELEPDAVLTALAMYLGGVTARMFGQHPAAVREALSVVFDAMVAGAKQEMEG